MVKFIEIIAMDAIVVKIDYFVFTGETWNEFKKDTATESVRKGIRTLLLLLLYIGPCL